MDSKLKFQNQTQFEVTPGVDGKPTTVSGYAIVWGAVTSDSRRDKKGSYKVRILPHSAVFSDPTFGLFNHSYDNVLARSDDNSLRLSADDKGIKFEMELPDTSLGRDLAWLIANKKIRGVSFSAIPSDYQESSENGQRIINFKSFKSDEVTITPVPAFKESSVDVKSEVAFMSADDDNDKWDFSDAASSDKEFTKSIEDLASDELKLDRYRLSFYSL